MDQNITELTRFETHFRKALQADVMTADRVQSVISDTVPPRRYGLLLLCFTEALSESSIESSPIDAAVAIEFSLLHQYLHMIPQTDDERSYSIKASVYAEDADAAILDGDFLQSCAFTRLSAGFENSAMTRRCYKILAQASVKCYERIHNDSTAAVTAPLLGSAARIGSVIGGVDQTTAVEIDQLTRSIAGAVPVQLPGENNVDQSSTPPVSEIQSTIKKLDTVVTNSVSTTQPLEPLLVDIFLRGSS